METQVYDELKKITWFAYFTNTFLIIQTAVAIPEDSGYTVYSSTQWIQQVQFAVAGVLGISNNK